MALIDTIKGTMSDFENWRVGTITSHWNPTTGIGQRIQSIMVGTTPLVPGMPRPIFADVPSLAGRRGFVGRPVSPMMVRQPNRVRAIPGRQPMRQKGFYGQERQMGLGDAGLSEIPSGQAFAKIGYRP